jgi:hypothetical protein
MLKVDQYDYIRTAHRVYGKTIRQIARKYRGRSSVYKLTAVLKDDRWGYADNILLKQKDMI